MSAARERAEQALANLGPDLPSLYRCVDALRALLAETGEPAPAALPESPWTWERVARRVGEEFARTGPDGYYEFGPAEWQDWMLGRIYATPAPAALPEGVKEAAERMDESLTHLGKVNAENDDEWGRAVQDIVSDATALLAALDAKAGRS